jgi:hypothetical protein
MKYLKRLELSSKYKDYKALLKIEIETLVNSFNMINALSDLELSDFYNLLNDDLEAKNNINAESFKDDITRSAYDRLIEGNYSEKLENIIRGDFYYSINYYAKRKKEDPSFKFDIDEEAVIKSQQQDNLVYTYITQIKGKHIDELNKKIFYDWTSELRKKYFRDFYKKPWAEYEKLLISSKSSRISETYNYLINIGKFYIKEKGIPKKELHDYFQKYHKELIDILVNDGGTELINYIKFFIKGRWKEKEDLFFKNMHEGSLIEYSKISKKIFPEIVDRFFISKYEGLPVYFNNFLRDYFKTYDKLKSSQDELNILYSFAKKNDKAEDFFESLYSLILKLEGQQDNEENHEIYYLEIFEFFPKIIEFNISVSPRNIIHLLESIFKNIIENKDDWKKYSPYLIEYQKNFELSPVDLKLKYDFKRSAISDSIYYFITIINDILKTIFDDSEIIKIMLNDFKNVTSTMLDLLGVTHYSVRDFLNNVIKDQRWPEYEDKLLQSKILENIFLISTYNKKNRKGLRWPELEKTLIKRSLTYEMNVYLTESKINERIPEYENLLIKTKNSYDAFIYVRNVVKKKVSELETMILSDKVTAPLYNKLDLK